MEDEEIDEQQDMEIKVVDFEGEEKDPLYLLFPDLESEKEMMPSDISTTQLTQMLVGKKADFSLLKPSRKLNPLQVCPGDFYWKLDLSFFNVIF